MAAASKVSFEIAFKNLKLLPGVIEYAEAGALTGGAGANRFYLESKVKVAEHHDKHVFDIIYDAQTSGGLLIAVAEDRAALLLQALLDRGVDAADIGRAIPFDDAVIHII
jgi:selenide,water dikinase